MMRAFIFTLLAATLVAAGAFYFVSARDTREAIPVPPPASVEMSTTAAAPTMAEGRGNTSRERNEQLALEIERALVARDVRQRETAFNFLLPELLAGKPDRVFAIVARQEPGETRDLLRDEVARLLITRDRDAAVAWLKSLENPAESKAGATVAVRTLAATSPAEAIYVADQFGIGRDDGSLEHMVQIWATENLDEATRWIESQPEGPQTAQLRASIEQVRAQRSSSKQ